MTGTTVAANRIGLGCPDGVNGGASLGESVRGLLRQVAGNATLAPGAPLALAILEPQHNGDRVRILESAKRPLR
jgi:hypothetical protein